MLDLHRPPKCSGDAFRHFFDAALHPAAHRLVVGAQRDAKLGALCNAVGTGAALDGADQQNAVLVHTHFSGQQHLERLDNPDGDENRIDAFLRL